MTDKALNKVAIFGGTFDPPHLAHRDLILEISKEFHFQKIFIIPSRFPPGKTAVADYETRLKWTQKCFEGLKEIEISDLERNTTETIFGVDIFRELSLKVAPSEIFWILGEDQWEQISFWQKIENYGPEITWLVMPREKKAHTANSIHSYRLRNNTLAYRWARTKLRNEISSSKIREEVQAHGKSAEALKWVSESTREEIIKTYSKQGGIV